MNQPESDSLLEKQIGDNLAEFSTEINLKGSVLEIAAKKEQKRIEVVWVINVKEVYFDFYEGGRKIFTDWGDFYYLDKLSELHDHIINVINGFLKLPTRVVKEKANWLSPTITELQVYENEQWTNIFLYA